jgi:malonate transporter
MAVRWKVLDSASARGLNTFVFWLALPSLLLSSVARSALTELLDWRLLSVFYGVNIILYVGSFLVGRLLWGDPPGVAGLRSLGVIWGNYGYLGIPLLMAVLGPAGALPAVTVVTFDILLPASLTIALLEAGSSGQAPLAGVRRALGGIARNPLILAVATGIILSTAGLDLPAAAANFLALLGNAAGPCALVALGAALALSPSGGASHDVTMLAVLKLLANPALVWLAGSYLIVLAPQQLAAVTLLAAMPTASSVFVLAQRYETWVVRASTSVLVTHIGSVATLGALLYLFSR